MAGKITFTMIKPGAVLNEYIGPILKRISDEGFHIAGLKYVWLTKKEARTFYSIHKERPFYESLVKFMTSGPVVAAILEKDNAVEDFRALIGATNPEDAAEGTIRKKYAESISANAIHGSDSDDNAQIESSFHFSGREMF